MTTLTVWKFDSAGGAQSALAQLERMQKEELIQVNDAAYVTWPEGKKKPSTTPNSTASTPSSNGLTSPPATTKAKTTMITVRNTSDAMIVGLGPSRSTKTPPINSRAA